MNTVIARQVEEDEDEEAGGGKTRRVMYGDNTDWRGFYTALRRRLGAGDHSADKARAVLIVGAGGAAPGGGVCRVGARRRVRADLLQPRTPAKASELAETFGGRVVTDLEGGLKSILDDMDAEVRVVISGLPAAADFVLPQWLIKDAEDEDGNEGGALSPPSMKPSYTT